MNQAYYTDLGYNPRYEVTDPEEIDRNLYIVYTYDWSYGILGNNIVATFRFTDLKKAEAFSQSMQEKIGDWEVDDYYEVDDPYMDYVANEMRYLCSKN